ncbi:hypothetical protein [Leptolyngbya sp. FACHB-261]|uniref:hypothetical protein n=1 Tax=Leptolyngbya sp. FACHB-261 TaxID=2692806 RepID=UPI00168447F7|nr:hypothetical protein [Leptolyngbya sp. FACHB-261]MBD2104122.1 hypothetical protein [Leptolyngbya sp. FACHB-261]
MTSQTPENGHPYPEQPEGLLEILQRLDRNLELLTDLTGRLAEEQTATRIEVQGLHESSEQRYAALDQRIGTGYY